MELKATDYWQDNIYTQEHKHRLVWLKKYITSDRKKRLVAAYFSQMPFLNKENKQKCLDAFGKYIEKIILFADSLVSFADYNRETGETLHWSLYYCYNRIIDETGEIHWSLHYCYLSVRNAAIICYHSPISLGVRRYLLRDWRHFIGVINQSLATSLPTATSKFSDANFHYCNQLLGLFVPLDNWKLSYHTTNVVQLAETIYQTQDWSLCPILADALMDAGCENEYILWLLKEKHDLFGRGVWLLDQLTGRS